MFWLQTPVWFRRKRRGILWHFQMLTPTELLQYTPEIPPSSAQVGQPINRCLFTSKTHVIPHWREPSRRILWCFFKQPHLFSRLSFTYKGCLTFNGQVKEGEKSTGSKGLTQAQLKHGGVNAVDRALERQNKKAPGMLKKALCSIETLRHSSSVVNKSKQSGQSHFTYNS